MKLVRYFFTTIVFLVLSATFVSAAEVSERLKSNGALVPGTLVSRTEGDSDIVQAAFAYEDSAIAGFIVEEEATTVSLGGLESDVIVASSGIASILVSDINGEVKSGTKLAASQVYGVAAKLSDQKTVVAVALEQFPTSEAAVLQSVEVDGVSYDIGYVKARIDIQPNTKGSASPIPGILQEFSNNLVGREVSPVRITVALILLITVFTIDGVLLYATVRSTIISIGRNPLSKHTVFKSLIPIVLVVLGITCFGLGASYLVLVTS